MIHPIVIYDDPTLKQVSEEIPYQKFPKIEELVDDMFETMHKANGIGLSAIQIGIPLRIFVIEAHLENENFHFRETFINPKMIRKWGNKVKLTEGCLSVPQIFAQVERNETIELSYYDSNWKFHTKIFKGLKSRIIQHEYDHLEGILFIEHLDNMWKKIIESPLETIKNKNIEIPYLVKNDNKR